MRRRERSQLAIGNIGGFSKSSSAAAQEHECSQRSKQGRAWFRDDDDLQAAALEIRLAAGADIRGVGDAEVFDIGGAEALGGGNEGVGDVESERVPIDVGEVGDAETAAEGDGAGDGERIVDILDAEDRSGIECEVTSQRAGAAEGGRGIDGDVRVGKRTGDEQSTGGDEGGAGVGAG